MVNREQHIAATFVELADTLVDDFDVIDFLHTLATRSVELLGASAAGIMLADRHGELHVMASSTEEARLLELYELQNNEGPCLDCFHTGQPVTRHGLSAMNNAWPTFTPQLQQHGFTAAQALPMRLRAETIGALNLFQTEPQPLTETNLSIGQAMADVATVGLLQQRAITAREQLATQLQTALTSRVQLEQAKGMLAQHTGLTTDQAFHLMRSYARGNNHRLTDVAASIIDGSLNKDLLTRAPGGKLRKPPRA